MSDEQEQDYAGGHIDTPVPEMRSRRHSDPIDTPYPVDGIAARPQPQYPAPRFWRLRQRPNPYFMGRESLMVTLHNTFQRHAMVHLLGPRGSGTTQTALAYAYRARPNFDAIFWIDGEDATIARFDLVRTGARLDDRWKDEARLQDQIDAIRAWMKTHLRWLLVVDGASNPDVFRAFPPDPPTGRVLITGDTPLGDAAIEVVEHPPFTHAQAGLFLAHRSQKQRDKFTGALVRHFGCASLPIFLAGAYCQVTDTSLEDYLAAPPAREDRKKKEKTPTNTPALGFTESTRIVVQRSLRYLSETDPAALEMMCLCAWFDTEDIALAMLCDGAPFLPKRLAGCVSDPESLNRALTLLHRLSLVQFEQNSIAIHAAVQEATRNLLDQDQQFAWLMTALRVVREAFPVESKYGHPIPACSMLLRHVYAVTARSEQSTNLREGTGLLLNHVGLYLHACRELDAARAAFERSIRLAESLYGQVHPTIAARVNSLGVILQEMKHYPEAHDCYERAFHICETVYGPAQDAALGPAHRSMLTMPSRNLCQVLELMGDIPGAKAAYQRAIKVFMEVYCWNHSLVAESMNGLGQIFLKEKNFAVARQYFEKAIQAEENADEPERGNLGRFLRNLGQCLLEEDKFRDARACYERALDADRKDYGPQHPHIASDLIGLGKALREVSLFEEAHRAFDDALSILKARSKDASREQANIWRQKGRTWMEERAYEKAVECLNEAIVTLRLAEGPDSPAMGPDYFYLARSLARLDRHSEAESALKSALDLHVKRAWMDEETLGAVCGRLCKALKEQKKVKRAIEILQDLLACEESRNGQTHESVGAVAYQLGAMHQAAYDYDAALECYQRSRDIYKATRGPQDSRVQRAIQRVELLQNLV